MFANMETQTLSARNFPAAAYTVYFDRAEAKREFPGIKLSKGLNEVVIENLPPTLQEEYLGVDGKGPAMIVDVRCSSQYSNPETDSLGSESSQKLQSLNKQKKTIQSQIEMLNSKEGVLRDVLVAFAGSDKFDFAGGLESYDAKKLETRVKKEELEEQLAIVEKKIREVGDTGYVSGHQVTGKTVKVNLEAEAACEVSLSITTIMESVTFTPHYTLRATSTGTDSTLKIRYHARISNTSGEDWNEVSLAISTAQASETTVIPRLMRWTVDFTSPVQKVQNYYGAKKSKGGAMLLNNYQSNMVQQQAPMQLAYASAPAPGRGMLGKRYSESEDGATVDNIETAAAEISEGITSTFIIPGKQTIKDGEKSHTVVIRDLVLEGKFTNICVPKIKDVAYLQARVKNDTDYPLLPGDVALFLDGAFVGKTEFAYVSPGEFLNVCLGVDKGITVKYHPRQTLTSKRGMVLNKSTVQGYSQQITIRNLKSSPLAKLTIMDQIPISEDRSIVVNMISPPKEKVIDVNDLEKLNVQGMGNTSKSSLRMSISEKLPMGREEKERDRIVWNPDTGRVTWDFVDVKEKKTVEVRLEWEVVSGDRTVYSHFGNKI